MEKEFKRGFLLGKFYPFHLGHCHLIEQSASKCENLVVLVCSLEREIIPGKLRFQWVKDYCKSINCNIKVIHHSKNVPQYPEEHIDFWNIWCDIIKETTPNGLDAIFSSEDYGLELSKRLNIKNVVVDRNRTMIPISGTEVRNNPYDNWHFIYNGARPYFMHKIYFLGSESTGKTTCSEMLANKFELNCVPEYGRILCERENGDINLNDFYEIVIKQREIENTLSKNTDKKIIIADTETITTKVFCDLYFPEESHKLEMFFNFHIKKQIQNSYKEASHYFVMSPNDVPAVQDGTRLNISDDSRQKHFQKIIKELDDWKIKYTILYGSYEKRVIFVEDYIRKLNL